MPTKNFSAYLFLGEEDFLKEEALEKLKSRFLDGQTKDLNYGVFYAKEKNFNIRDALDSLNTLPFLSKKRLVVLKDADSLTASARESMLLYLRNPKKTSVLIIESASSGIKGEFLLNLSRLSHLVNFKRLTDSETDKWLVRKAGLSGKKISPEAIKTAKENLRNDLRTLSSNMDNIVLYVGKRHLITKQDVEGITGISASHTGFDLIDSIGRKDVKKALRVFSSLKTDRKRQTELLGLLAWNTRMILRVKELLMVKGRMEIRRDLGLNPRAFDQIVRHAPRFKKTQLLLLLSEILNADLDIKTGASPAVVIERLVVRMCL